MYTMRIIILTLIVSISTAIAPTAAMAGEQGSGMITEAYYRVKWGHFDEFMELFKKNHFPILKQLQELGLITSITASFPVNHASEDSRWDFRLSLVIPDSKALAVAMPQVSKSLYPDQDKLKADERHRFSLLLAHTDILVRNEDTATW